MAFSPDGEWLAVAAQTHAPRLWNPATGRPGKNFVFEEYGFRDEDGQFDPLPRAATCMSFSPDGKTLAVGTFQFDVWLWDVPTGKVRGTLKNKGIVGCIAFGKRGKTIVVSSVYGLNGLPPEVVVWDLVAMRPIGSLRPDPRRVKLTQYDSFQAQALSLDGTLWVTASADKSIQLWELDRMDIASAL
jgi:WD40 repeat protein